MLQIDVYSQRLLQPSIRALPPPRRRWDKPRSTPPTRMPLTARSVVRLDAARALAGSLKRDTELADPAELSQPATVQEFGQRQQQLSDRAEHCLQGTLRDRALLREVEKLLRNVELDTEPDEADSQPARRVPSTAASAGSSSSAGYLPRPSGSTVLRGGALSARRATTSLRAGAAPQYRPASAREAAAQASGTQGEAAAVAVGVAVGVVPESVMARDARRLAHCDALTSQLQSVQLDFEAHWSQRLDAVAAGHARLQRQMDAALDISEEEMEIEIEKHRRAAEAEAEEEAEEDGAGARAAASALGRYLAGQQRVAHGRQPARPTDRQASTVASRRPAAGSVAPVGGGRGGGGSLRGAGRGAARGVPRPRRVPEGHEESSVR